MLKWSPLFEEERLSDVGHDDYSDVFLNNQFNFSTQKIELHFCDLDLKVLKDDLHKSLKQTKRIFF